MLFFSRNIFPYICFSASAVGLFIGTQQINLSQLAMAFVFVITIAAITLDNFSFKQVQPIKWFLLATLPGTLILVFSNSELYVPIRQYLVIFIAWMSVSFFFYLKKFSPIEIFKVYIKIALIFSIYGIFQQIFYLLNVPFLYDSRWLFIGAAEYTYQGIFLRTPSVFTEPSYFGIFLMPAVYFSFLRIGKKYFSFNLFVSYIFIFASLLTFSTWTYVGLFLSVMIAFKPNLSQIKLAPRNIFFLTFFLFGLISTIFSIPAISSRVLLIPQVLSGDLTGDENISLLVVGMNMAITIEAFFQNPLFGTGLGSYRLISKDILEQLFSSNTYLYNALMAMEDNLMLADGGLMYFRLPVELGIFGCLIIFWFLFININIPSNQLHKHIGIASMIFILVYSLRSGQIFRFEFIYFLSLYLLVFSKSYNYLGNKIKK